MNSRLSLFLAKEFISENIGLFDVSNKSILKKQLHFVKNFIEENAEFIDTHFILNESIKNVAPGGTKKTQVKEARRGKTGVQKPVQTPTPAPTPAETPKPSLMNRAAGQVERFGNYMGNKGSEMVKANPNSYIGNKLTSVGQHVANNKNFYAGAAAGMGAATVGYLANKLAGKRRRPYPRQYAEHVTECIANKYKELGNIKMYEVYIKESKKWVTK